MQPNIVVGIKCAHTHLEWLWLELTGISYSTAIRVESWRHTVRTGFLGVKVILFNSCSTIQTKLALQGPVVVEVRARGVYEGRYGAQSDGTTRFGFITN